MEILGLFFFLICITILFSILMAYPFMLIWNYAVVEALTICNEIDFWQAFWLMLFISLFISRPNGAMKNKSKS